MRVNKSEDFSKKFAVIAEVTQGFNFERVYAVMNFLDWNWITPEYGYRVPSIEQLKTTATRLLSDVYDELTYGKQEYTIGTGGFEASGYLDERGEFVMELKFILEKS